MMQVSESVKMALQSIGANRLRAFLTLLSISIGVFAIVGVAAAVGALEGKLDDQLAAFGRNSFIIQKYPAMMFGNMSQYRNRRDLSVRQGVELKRRLTSAQAISLTNQTFGAVVKHGKESIRRMCSCGATWR
jgi:putative ABC transport system permease protein